MAIQVGTNAQALARIGIITTISLVSSVTMTWLGLSYSFGSDVNATVPLLSVFKFGMVIAVIIPTIVAPLFGCRVVMVLRQRDLAQLALREIAETDQLTSLPNRRGFDVSAKAAFAGRDPRNPVMSLLMIDIDFFKSINDGFGHDFGDAALVRVASLLRDLAQSDALMVGRQGGEEFVALLPGRTEPEAYAIAERLREACARSAVEYGGRSAFMTVSIGIASSQNRTSLSELMSEADRALYCAKQQGRNRVIAYRPAAPRVLAA